MVRRHLARSGSLIFVVLVTTWAAAQLPNATDTTSTPAPGDHDYLQSLVETVNRLSAPPESDLFRNMMRNWVHKLSPVENRCKS